MMLVQRLLMLLLRAMVLLLGMLLLLVTLQLVTLLIVVFFHSDAVAGDAADSDVDGYRYRYASVPGTNVVLLV